MNLNFPKKLQATSYKLQAGFTPLEATPALARPKGLRGGLFLTGFTLIELLVVIAIIGILSGIVLTSLGSARNKAKISSAQASISSTRSQAELGADTAGKYVANICASVATGGLGTLLTAVNAQISDDAQIKCGGTGANSALLNPAWVVAANFEGVSTGAGYYCADSTGFAGAINSAEFVAVNGSFAGTYNILANADSCK